MTSQRKFKLIWLLLPLLALRALVPAGFMLDTSGGGVSMVVCHGAALSASMSGQQDQSDQHGKSVCPFAIATTGASAPVVLPIVLGTVSLVGTVSIDVAYFHSPFGPSRTQQSRAPPTFS